MRKIVISLAAGGAALAFASPAAAQYYPQQAPAYGYGQQYGNGYGFQNNWGQVRTLEARINNVERQINRLDRRDRAADRLRDEANRIERRLRDRARGGLNPYEMNDIQVRIARLEQRVQFAMNQRGNGYGYNGYNNGQFVDRDRDGRDDRFERRDRDGDRDGDRN